MGCNKEGGWGGESGYGGIMGRWSLSGIVIGERALYRTKDCRLPFDG